MVGGNHAELRGCPFHENSALALSSLEACSERNAMLQWQSGSSIFGRELPAPS